MHSKRQEWTFVYSGAALAAATAKLVACHGECVAHWQHKLEAAKAEMREQGIDFREEETPVFSATIAQLNIAGFSERGLGVQPFSPVFRLVQPCIVVDDSFQQRLTAYSAKLNEHLTLYHEYSVYHRTFELNPYRQLELTMDDIRYFGL